MGFGSYDESEQENQSDGSEIETSDEKKQADAEGEVKFEIGEDEDDEEAVDNLVEQLQEMKDEDS